MGGLTEDPAALVWFQESFLGDPELVRGAFGVIKAIAVFVFTLTAAGLLTWSENRLRVGAAGPVRADCAGVTVSGAVAAVFFAMGPAVAVVGATCGLLLLLENTGADRAWWGALFTHAGLVVSWITLALISRDVRCGGAKNFAEKLIASFAPRTLALSGFGAHVAFLLLTVYANTDFALESALADVTFIGGGAFFAGMVFAAGAHVAAQWKDATAVRLTFLGLLQPLSDLAQVPWKAERVPPKSDRLVNALAPWVAVLPALSLLAVVPFGPNLCFGSRRGDIDFNDFIGVEGAEHSCHEALKFSMQVADLNVGMLYVFAVGGLSFIGVLMAGFARDNKKALFEGMRAVAQTVSFNLPLGLSVVACVMVYGSVRLDEMVLWQAENAWGIFVQPVAFFLFAAAAIAQTKSLRFEIPPDESDTVDGRLALFSLAEFIPLLSFSALMAALFFGGWHVPFVTAHGIDVVIGEESHYADAFPSQFLAVVGVLAFLGKVLLLCALQLGVRWVLPRVPYDRWMKLGWQQLLPASLINLVVTGVIIVAIDSSGAKVQGTLNDLAQLSMVLISALGLLIAMSAVMLPFVLASEP